MSTFTTAKQLELVANSSYVGTWDQPTNSNWSVVDAALGGFISIPLNNSPVTLSTPQFQSAMITFNSTLTGNVPITFPTSFTGFYTILNACTGSSAFVVTLLTTAAGGQVIGCQPGDPFEVYNDGTNLKYKNLGRVGTYWDYAGSSSPLWVDSCTVPPFLNCDGTAFSSATYPQLSVILGGTTLPDLRGGYRATLNQGTSRLTSSGGVDGDTKLAVGGSQAVTLVSTNIPRSTTQTNAAFSFTLTGSGNLMTSQGSQYVAGATGTPADYSTRTQIMGIPAGEFSLLYGSTEPQPVANLPPTTISGITMIRAA